MIIPKKPKKGEKIAIVSLSWGIAGEEGSRHQIELGNKRIREFGFEPLWMPHSLKGIEYLKEHPDKRAEDLITAFLDPEIKGIITAIGGEDTFRLTPFLMENQFEKIVKENPKFFMGYSDTTTNHLLFYQLGLSTFYGPSFLTDFAELDTEMLPHTKKAFEDFLNSDKLNYSPSPFWYEERTDFSERNLNIKRIKHPDEKGYELLQGEKQFSGKLMGGCIESLYDLLKGKGYPMDRWIMEKYPLFTEKKEWKDSLIFLETSELQPKPRILKKLLKTLIDYGIFDEAKGIIIGKPQDEIYYEEYKKVFQRLFKKKNISIAYNFNFGHSYPKIILPYGWNGTVDMEKQNLSIEKPSSENRPNY